jgi:hypothetical protein
MRKEQVDLANRVVFISDSKTPTGACEVPLTEIAVKAFPGKCLSAATFRAAQNHPNLRLESGIGKQRAALGRLLRPDITKYR